MKKLIITSAVAVAMATNAYAIEHLATDMQSTGGWIDRIGGSAGEDMATL